MALKHFDDKPVTQQRFIHTGSHLVRDVDQEEHEIGHEAWELVRTRVIGVGYKQVSPGGDEQRRVETATVTKFAFLAEKVGNTLAEKYLPKDEPGGNGQSLDGFDDALRDADDIIGSTFDTDPI